MDSWVQMTFWLQNKGGAGIGVSADLREGVRLSRLSHWVGGWISLFFFSSWQEEKRIKKKKTMRGLIIYKPRFSGASKRREAYLLGREIVCNDHIRFVSLFIYISAEKETSKKNSIQRAICWVQIKESKSISRGVSWQLVGNTFVTRLPLDVLIRLSKL